MIHKQTQISKKTNIEGLTMKPINLRDTQFHFQTTVSNRHITIHAYGSQSSLYVIIFMGLRLSRIKHVNIPKEPFCPIHTTAN